MNPIITSWVLISLGIMVLVLFITTESLWTFLKKKWRFLYLTAGGLLVAWGTWRFIIGNSETTGGGGNFWFALAWVVNIFLIFIAGLDRR